MIQHIVLLKSTKQVPQASVMIQRPVSIFSHSAIPSPSDGSYTASWSHSLETLLIKTTNINVGATFLSLPLPAVKETDNSEMLGKAPVTSCEGEI
jgi:hypothetical protein